MSENKDAASESLRAIADYLHRTADKGGAHLDANVMRNIAIVFDMALDRHEMNIAILKKKCEDRLLKQQVLQIGAAFSGGFVWVFMTFVMADIASMIINSLW
jgi:hypothetical protein